VIHRVVRISDKGRAKDLITNDPNKYYDGGLICFNKNHIGINFKPKFISFCSEDDSEIDSYKYLYY